VLIIGLRRIISKKTSHTFELLGCTPLQLRQYLSSLFKPGMTFDNFGEWHIDHIMPLAAFDITDPEQQRQACHYTNLQPLWAAENLSKGCKIYA
jgi:hypothetical protein